ncbi:MAG: helix-turn-helix domain-containing protein [Ruminococcus sp.]|nr:helix-turn-helix domain-containing protein [Ruminococcus sp.]
MKSFYVLEDALRFIEENLENDFTQNDVADACYISLSGLQKLFRFALHFSVGEYIVKRRMTCAAKALCETDASVTEIAFRYGYNSPEVFTRAFTRVWHVKPSEFRKTRRHFFGICPPVYPPQENGGTVHMRNRFDISELYDYLQSNKGTYALGFDIRNLHPINTEIGREAGDLAIVEAMSRIDAACGDGMIALRLGGDEFVLVTTLSDPAAAKELLDGVLEKNGNPVVYQGQEIPISLHGCLFEITAAYEGGTAINYQHLMNKFNTEMDDARRREEKTAE